MDSAMTMLTVLLSHKLHNYGKRAFTSSNQKANYSLFIFIGVGLEPSGLFTLIMVIIPPGYSPLLVVICSK